MKNDLHTPLKLSTRRADVIVNAFGVDIATTASVDHALPIIRAVNAHDDLLAFVRTVLAGASITGRWLDSTGTAIDEATSEDDPPETEDGEPATWEPFTKHETEAWLGGIADEARALIAKVEG